jgi:hypothetical protein
MSNSIRKLLVNSIDRAGGTSDDFIIRIPSAPIQGLKKYKLLSANIPNTIYNITALNSSVYFQSSANFTATLAPGAYDLISLANALALAMTAADSANTYTVTFSSVTMKMTFAGTSAFKMLSGSFAFPQYPAMWNIIGFSNSPDTTTASMSITAPYVFDLGLPSYLLVAIDEFYNADCLTSSGFRANFAISMTGNSQNIEIFNENSQYDVGNNVTSVNPFTSLHIHIRNPDGSALSFNGADIALLFEFLY